MITDFLFSILNAIIGTIFSALPTSSLSGVFDSITAFMAGVWGWLMGWNFLLPMSEMSAYISILMTTWIPALVVYMTAEWLWKHIPTVAGFGTGNG